MGRWPLLIALATSFFLVVIPVALFFALYKRKLKYESFLPTREESIGSRLRRQKPSSPKQAMFRVCLYGLCAALYTASALEDARHSLLRWVAATVFWLVTITFAIGVWRASQKIARLKRLPRQEGFKCPSCGEPPQIGDYWACKLCKKAFDTFNSLAVCPNCSARHATTACLNCKERNPMSDWAIEGRASVTGTNENALAN